MNAMDRLARLFKRKSAAPRFLTPNEFVSFLENHGGEVASDMLTLKEERIAEDAYASGLVSMGFGGWGSSNYFRQNGIQSRDQIAAQ